MVNPLSKVAREIVLGCLYGDGCIRKPSGTHINPQGKRINYYRHYKFQIRHSPRQREYVWWLYGHLKPLCHSEPKEYRSYHKKNKKYYSCLDIVTRTHSFFTRLRKLYYPEGKKRIRRKILNKFTPLSLAVWFMDDGTSDKKRRVWLSTNSFSEKEQGIIQRYFLEKWGIDTRVVKERNQFKISFTTDGSRKFCDLVKPYIIPSMRYKLI